MNHLLVDLSLILLLHYLRDKVCIEQGSRPITLTTFLLHTRSSLAIGGPGRHHGMLGRGLRVWILSTSRHSFEWDTTSQSLRGLLILGFRPGITSIVRATVGVGNINLPGDLFVWTLEIILPDSSFVWMLGHFKWWKQAAIDLLAHAWVL